MLDTMAGRVQHYGYDNDRDHQPVSAEDEKLALIGRDYVLIRNFAKALHDKARSVGDYTPLRDVPRGQQFDVRLASGHVARVTVELDRIDAPDA